MNKGRVKTVNEILEKIKKYLGEMNNKKVINNLFILLLVTVMILIISNIFLDSNKKVEEYDIENGLDEYNYNIRDDYSGYLEGKLIRILSKFDGVDEVDVMITLEDSVEKITAANTTKTSESNLENDGEGGTREVIREDLSIQVITQGNDESLMVTKEIQPTIKGVIVIVNGDVDPILKEALYESVKTVLGVTSNRIVVYSNK